VGLALAASCGTDARGIEDCRSIEEARCDAAVACGQIDDAAACKRFYRDQCLHGLSVPAPGAPFTKQCVQAIRDAAECAKATEEAVEAACTAFRTQTRACKYVEAPETLRECAFLTPDAPPAEEGGSGGAAGDTSASTGGTASGGTSSAGSASEGGTVSAEGGGTSAEGGGSAAAGAAGVQSEG
jgi:hypothetical protein